MQCLSPLAVLAAFCLAVPARAQSPESLLALCRRDTKNAVSRLNARGGSDGSGASTLEGVSRLCLEGPKAEQLKSVSGYADFLAEFEAARSLMASQAQAADAARDSARQAAFDSAPGGPNTRQRWKTMPERCAPPSWQTIDGKTPRARAARTSAAARITGEEPAVPAGQVDPRIFEREPHRPASMSGDDWVARLACGHDVEGITPSFLERDLLGSIERGGSITALADSLGQEAGTPRATLRHAALVHQCFAASAFDVKRDYLRYLWCMDAVGTPPSPEFVAQAADASFPEDGWERRNFRFLYERALAARQAVVAAFTRAEASWPVMKAVYRDTIAEARAKHAERRTRYSELLQSLDPITAAVEAGSAPKDCLETLRPLRARLSRELAPKDEDGIHMLRAVHPVGYQISESLAACYLAKHQDAHALLELRGLSGANRRVTVDEEIFFALESAVAAAKQEFTGEEADAQIPNLGFGPHYGVPFPASLGLVGQLWERVKDARTVGDSGFPVDIARMEPGADGVKVSFKPVEYPWQAQRCYQTDKIDRIDYRGSQARVIYKTECEGVGPVVMKTHQEPPLVVSKEDAATMKPGMRVVLLVSADGRDVAVERLEWPGKKGAVVLRGVALDVP